MREPIVYDDFTVTCKDCEKNCSFNVRYEDDEDFIPGCYISEEALSSLSKSCQRKIWNLVDKHFEE